ncbi:MBOAT family O-acyltransferase [Mangrovimonas xylaniphaga]|uniref:MBOAT family O-acyltransferase n=1 Tax=Mangrovimonas xylaniphaga TaxID=1645915 RepID=UPI0006B67340|nr:MBOAT family O-acyltransferase [Mangrovimonas xylaniphaga]
MLFNSLTFAVFLPIVFMLYWFVFKRSLKRQNVLLLLASYVFYGWWDWRFLGLILLSTLVDFFVGLQLHKTEAPKQRKFYLLFSLCVNLGLLGFFKYYHFFIESWIDAWSFFGIQMHASTLEIILPVGISFYTFQTLSYTIDVYRKQLEATRDFVQFATFVAFFPQLVAGPIERASHLLPQFSRERKFDYSNAMNGLRQILWGLFKKIVIADNCARYVNIIFEGYDSYSGSTLFVGAILFSFQIYGDFSGYSDIAIGTARLFGFDLKQNFAFPYFSRDIAEFWRRWHISLSTWFKDYLYIPLGGSRVALSKIVRNVFVIFVISGLWHGANWTYIVWGLLNALYFLPLLVLKRNKVHIGIVAEDRILPSIHDFRKMAVTFILITFAWIFFRSKSVFDAFQYLKGVLNETLFTIPEIRPTFLFVLIMIFVLIEWMGRRGLYGIESLWGNYPKGVRWGVYYVITMIIFLFGAKQQEFIYFQF